MIRRALVLAAGLGSRIRAVAGDKPKPLLLFAGVPVLARNLRWLAEAGVGEVFINLHFAAAAIRAEIGDGAAFGLTITYVYEDELKGTAGALGNIPTASDGPIWVVYGDSLVRCDLEAMGRAHRTGRAELTMALFDQDRHLHTGIAGGRVIVAADGRVTAFAEGAQAGSSLVNAGVYLVEPSVLEFIPSDRPSDFGRDVFPAMLAQDRVLLGHVMDDQGYCLGLDTPESYAAGLRLSADARLVMS